jgi:glucokinase
VFVLNAVLTEARIPISALGVGCGGPMQWPSGDVSPLNIPAWRDFPLLERLSEDFGLPVRVHNDAICLTIGEHLAGAGRGRDNVMGMVVSTGVGGGLILDGRLVDGTSGNAGHIGHVVIDPEGPPCGCGGRGCLEAVARGPAVVAWAREHGWHGPSDADGAVLAGAARSGDAVAVAAFRRCGDALGTAIASAAALLDLELVAIGGGISYAADLVLPALFDAFERHAGFEFVRRCRIVLAASSSRLVGAAGLFAEGYWHGDAPALTESRMNPSS